MKRTIKGYIRASLATALIAHVTACAHLSPTARVPSSVEIESLQNAQLVNMYKNTAAVEAFILGPPDARGEQRPVCHVDVTNQSRLVPSYIPLARRHDPSAFAIPECTGEQLDQIAAVAMSANRPQYAAGPLVALAGICLIDIGFSVIATAATNHVTNRVVDRKPHMRGIKAGVQTGGTAVAGTAAGIAIARAVPTMRLISAGAIGAICTSAGVYVGYLLVPPQ